MDTLSLECVSRILSGLTQEDFVYVCFGKFDDPIPHRLCGHVSAPSSAGGEIKIDIGRKGDPSEQVIEKSRIYQLIKVTDKDLKELLNSTFAMVEDVARIVHLRGY